MKNTIELQQALHHSPGKFSSVLMFTAKSDRDLSVIRLAVSSLLKLIETSGVIPKNLHILVALNATLIAEELQKSSLHSAPKLFPLGEKNRLMPNTQADVLVQIAAKCRTNLVFASRLVCDCLTAELDCVVEHSGGTILFGQEPFGFTHGKTEEAHYLQQTAAITDAPLAGGTWLLYQCYLQDLTRFFQGTEKRDLAEQKEVIGAQHARMSFRADSDQVRSAHRSHKNIVSNSQGKIARPYMIRRGFAYRRDGEEGTIFLATAKKPDIFATTLKKMIAKDLLLDYAMAIEGGLYFVPPSGEWLSPVAKPAILPPSAQMLSLAMKPKLNKQRKQGKLAQSSTSSQSVLELEDYETVASFITFIKALRSHDSLFEGSIGNQQINPDIAVLLEAMYTVLAGGTLVEPPQIEGQIDKKYMEKLKRLQAEFVDDANQLNKDAGMYMTVV